MSNEKYNKPYIQALKQAISLSTVSCEVKRQAMYHFNDKGRSEPMEETIYLDLAVTPSGEHSAKQNMQGTWSSEQFKITYIYPDWLNLEDIVIHPVYGELRVTSIEDMREYGASTATAERVNSIRNMYNKGENR